MSFNLYLFTHCIDLLRSIYNAATPVNDTEFFHSDIKYFDDGDSIVFYSNANFKPRMVLALDSNMNLYRYNSLNNICNQKDIFTLLFKEHERFIKTTTLNGNT